MQVHLNVFRCFPLFQLREGRWKWMRGKVIRTGILLEIIALGTKFISIGEIFSL